MRPPLGSLDSKEESSASDLCQFWLETMRKYYKLALILVTAASLVCLLFYKTQYDKLYRVLQVLEFFGEDAGSTIGCPRHVSTSFSPPAFRRVSADAYVYSAFCTSSADSSGCAMVTAPALALGDEAVQGLRCQLWYTGSLKPMEGVFSSNLVMSEDNDKEDPSMAVPWFFNCESKYTDRTPYGVSFIKSKSESSYVPVDVQSDPPQDSSLGICLFPQSTREESTQAALENVLLNSYFGAKKFLIYDNGMTSKFLKTVSDAQHEDPLLVVHVVPWNPPFPLSTAHTEALIRSDCHLRAAGLWESVALGINLTQILVPKVGSTVQRALVASEGASASRVEVPVRHFCAELPADKASAANTFKLVALEQASFDRSLSSNDRKVVIVKKHAGESNTDDSAVVVSQTDLAVWDFNSCGKLDFAAGEVARDAHLLNMRQAVQDKIGKFFPLKNV